MRFAKIQQSSSDAWRNFFYLPCFFQLYFSTTYSEARGGFCSIYLLHNHLQPGCCRCFFILRPICSGNATCRFRAPSACLLLLTREKMQRTCVHVCLSTRIHIGRAMYIFFRLIHAASYAQLRAFCIPRGVPRLVGCAAFSRGRAYSLYILGETVGRSERRSLSGGSRGAMVGHDEPNISPACDDCCLVKVCCTADIRRYFFSSFSRLCHIYILFTYNDT